MIKLYENAYHRTVAEIDLGLYNWKRHSTGYLLKELHTIRWGNFHEYWKEQWELRLRDELAKRPHVSNKRERKANK